jgi:hypothetical protein
MADYKCWKLKRIELKISEKIIVQNIIILPADYHTNVFLSFFAPMGTILPPSWRIITVGLFIGKLFCTESHENSQKSLESSHIILLRNT